MSRRIKRKRGNSHGVIVVTILLLIVLVIGGFAGFKLWESNQEYVKGDESYAALLKTVRGGKGDPKTPTPNGVVATDSGTDNGPAPMPTPAVPAVEIPEGNIDFAALKAVNEDSVAWLYCPDTMIDYPVMKSDDYNYYIDHLPDGTRNKNGTLFFDYNCAPDLSDRLSIIYGHHMKSGKMFGRLVDFKDQDYVDAHPYMYLYTESMNYRVALKYSFEIGSSDWQKRRFMYPENVDELLAYGAAHSRFRSDVTYDENDRFLTLYTCDYEFDNARFVVIGVLQPEYSG